jgi:hypothetical protein
MGQEKYRLFDALYDDLHDQGTYADHKPLLAHYTSIGCIESILKTKQLWFSNPLFMNDLEELKYGLLEGRRLFLDAENVQEACGSQERVNILEDRFEHYFQEFDLKEAFDIYAFCLSEHQPNNLDGLLSMWRGYGSNGKGAALVFDTSKIEYMEGNALILSKVIYASHNERQSYIKELLAKLANLLKQANLEDSELYLAAHALFERLKLFALFTKHEGFREEQEWRVVYLPDRDKDNKLDSMLDYNISEAGIQPKLKFKFQAIEGVTPSNISFENLLHSIILGPSLSSALGEKSIKRMLEKTGNTHLIDKVKSSSIPFRTY